MSIIEFIYATLLLIAATFCTLFFIYTYFSYKSDLSEMRKTIEKERLKSSIKELKKTTKKIDKENKENKKSKKEKK